jgi:hypothetical protein
MLIELLETVLPHLRDPNSFAQHAVRKRDTVIQRTGLEHTA